MKEILSTKTKNYSRIEIAWQREFMEEINGVLMLTYVTDHHSAYEDILSHQIYIRTLSKSVDYLYKYYELDKEYFELLNFAADSLEQLCNGRIPCSSEPDEIERAKVELGDYLDKVTMIFQTAADKTEDARYQEFYSAMAQKYSEEADRAHGVISMRSYEAKMQILYEGAAREYKADFVKELLQQRAAKYREKCRVRETVDGSSARFFADTSREGEDREPLLGSGLRKRAITIPDMHSMES